MNNSVKYFIAFSLGAAAGVAASWKILKDKYERLAQEEINSYREVRSRLDNDEEKIDHEEEDQTDPKFEEYAVIASKYSGTEVADEEKNIAEVIEPYVIVPEELGETNYEIVSLTYYNDGVLTDDMGLIIDDDDIADIIGESTLTQIGVHEEDAVHVRNDNLKRDYEILYNPENYADLQWRDLPRSTEE